MEKRLTRRQQQFLTQFIDIFRESGKPLSYHYIAERMRVGKISVYEMLRLLEQYGFVKTEYKQGNTPHRPGRPAISFSPTKQAFDLTQRLVMASDELEHWSAKKEDYISRLQDHDPFVYSEFHRELLSRIQSRKTPLLHVTDMVTIILLIISCLPSTEKISILWKKITRVGYPGEISLHTFYGIALAVSCMDQEDKRISDDLFNNISRYEYYLQDMHIENHNRVCSYIREAARVITNSRI